MNRVGAKKGEYVEFTIPDENMAVGALLCFGLPLFLVLVCAALGMYFGPRYGYTGQNGAIAGFIIGIPVAVAAIKTYDLTMKKHNNKSEVIGIIDER